MKLGFVAEARSPLLGGVPSARFLGGSKIDRVSDMRIMTAIAFCSGLLATPMQAQACRMIVPQGLSSFQEAVVVSVQSSKRLSTTPFNVWRIQAKPKLVISGSPSAETYVFHGRIGISGCQNDRPKRGALWVLYLREGAADGVDQAYPLDYVRAYDARLDSVR